MIRAFTCPDPVPLCEEDYVMAARRIGCELAAIRAVVAVESRGGFLADGRPKILFERHIFHRLTGGRFSAGHRQISARLAGGYRGGMREYDRLEAAMALDRDAALKSASWGAFQIMGFNHAAAGHDAIGNFVAAMVSGEAAQLTAFCAFITHERLGAALRDHDWAGFARRYNGPAYRRNAYDQKLAAAYARFSGERRAVLRMGDKGAGVRQLQQLLEIAADGIFGRQTRAALVRFQQAERLIADGVAGPQTWSALAGD